MLDKYTTIIFDVSGTLLERVPNETYIIMDKCKFIGKEVTYETALQANHATNEWANQQILKEINGSPYMEADEFYRNINKIAMCEALGIDDADVNKSLKHLKQYKNPPCEWKVMDGVVEMLDMLKDRKLGIVSNFSSDLVEVLEEKKLSHYFESVIASEAVQVEKPNKEIMDIACKDLGVNIKDCIYIGDHPFDVLCAKSAGMDVVWLTGEYKEFPTYVPQAPDYIINHIRELCRL